MDSSKSKNKTKVYVALSGGVDSSVSLALLQKEGYDVTGVYMKNWSGDDFGIQTDCPWETDQADAEAVCKYLGVPFMSFNFEKQYRAKVVDYFFSEYEKGRTPNPDVMCNKEIKFKLFLDRALEEGADLIATGHYARRIDDADGVHLYTGLDDIKNQVYFLYNVTQDQLSKTFFPVGGFPKSKVRELAKEFGLPNKDKKDSQGICFIGEIDVLKFLSAQIPEKAGDIVDIDTGEKVGEHKGIYFYTIGQRKGLGVGGQEVPYYVCKKDPEKNILYVCHSIRHKALFSDTAELEDIHWICNPPKNPDQLSACHRYQQKPQSGKYVFSDGVHKFIFDSPQRAITSGQSLVIFSGEECLGGGIIS